MIFIQPIAPSGLYWVVPVPNGGLEVAPGGKSVTLAMQDVAVVDQPRWPALDASATPAKMSFKMVWNRPGSRPSIRTRRGSFDSRARGRSAKWRHKWKFLRLGFSWKSDPLATSSAAFAIIGNETKRALLRMKIPVVALPQLIPPSAVTFSCHRCCMQSVPTDNDNENSHLRGRMSYCEWLSKQ